MRQLIGKVLCLIGWHRWTTEQDLFRMGDAGRLAVVAWKQCERCFHGKLLIHILCEKRKV